MDEEKQKKRFLAKISILGCTFDFRKKLLCSILERKNTPIHIPEISVFLITVDNIDYTVQVWNNSDSIPSTLIIGSSGGILVFDRSDRATLEKIQDCKKDFRSYANSPEDPIALVGVTTKEQVISTQEGKEVADAMDGKYFETNFPTFTNFEEILHHLIKVAQCQYMLKNQQI